MLDKIDLTQTLSKRDYKDVRPALRSRLFALQRACWEYKIPVIIVFEGWDAAGKGTTITALTQPLEPRGFSLHAIQAPRTAETHLPWLWRFWQRLPNHGEIAIFDRSWYGRVLVERVEGLVPEPQWRAAFRDIVDFERTLSDDGTTIVKFFLHIARDEQERRFRALEADPLTEWQVQAEDWEHHKAYDAYVVAIEEMLELTEAEWAPWTVVSATDMYWMRRKVFTTIIDALEYAIRSRGLDLPSNGIEPDHEDRAEDADELGKNSTP